MFQKIMPILLLGIINQSNLHGISKTPRNRKNTSVSKPSKSAAIKSRDNGLLGGPGFKKANSTSQQIKKPITSPLLKKTSARKPSAQEITTKKASYDALKEKNETKKTLDNLYNMTLDQAQKVALTKQKQRQPPIAKNINNRLPLGRFERSSSQATTKRSTRSKS